MTPKEKALANMNEYMRKNNYGLGDYPTYSRDPEWKKLNEELKRSAESNTKAQAQSSNNFKESLKVIKNQSTPSNQQKKSTNKFVENLKTKMKSMQEKRAIKAQENKEKQTAKMQKKHGNGMGY